MNQEDAAYWLEYFTNSHFESELNTFSYEQLRLVNDFVFRKKTNSKVIEFSRYLYENYKFENLAMKDDQKRNLFAFAMAQCWLFTRIIKQHQKGNLFQNCFSSPLSIILTLDYELNINETEIIEELTGKKIIDLEYPKPSKLTIDYQNKFSNWGFLIELSNSPLCDIKTLILATNAMSTKTKLLEFSRIEKDKCVEKGIVGLRKSGVIEFDVPDHILLAIFPYKDIKKFASNNGIKCLPTRKDEAINLIKEKLSSDRISDFVFTLLNNPGYGYKLADELFLLPTIPKARVFQNYIQCELNRLSLYLEFIGCVEHDNKTILTKTLKRKPPGRRSGDIIQRVSSDNDFADSTDFGYIHVNLTPNDENVIRKYWDENCERIFKNIINLQTKDNQLIELINEIIAYWHSEGVLQIFKTETKSLSYPKHWYWLLSNYCQKLIRQERISLTSKIKTCAGCTNRFSEFSVPQHIAERIDYNVLFCHSCYSYIFGHRYTANTTKKFNMAEENKLTYLFEICKTLEIIPTQAYMANIELPAKPNQKQKEVGKILLEMPSYDIYVEIFGSWLNSLAKSGVLNDGHRKTSRGIHCIANDGHVCLSLGEKVIDDWLGERNISHEKEYPYPYDEELNKNELLRTDWRVGNIFIEYAGLMNDAAYAYRIDNKKKVAAKNGIRLVIIEPDDLFHLGEKLEDLFH